MTDPTRTTGRRCAWLDQIWDSRLLHLILWVSFIIDLTAPGQSGG